MSARIERLSGRDDKGSAAQPARDSAAQPARDHQDTSAPQADSLPGVVSPAADLTTAGSGVLPFTGSDSLLLLLVAASLISVGAAVLLSARQGASRSN